MRSRTFIKLKHSAFVAKISMYGRLAVLGTIRVVDDLNKLYKHLFMDYFQSEGVPHIKGVLLPD